MTIESSFFNPPHPTLSLREWATEGRVRVMLIFCLFTCSGLAFAANPPGPELRTVAVMDFKATEVMTEESQAVADFLRSAISENSKGRYKPIDRKSIGAILADMKMDIAIGKDVDVAVRVGKLLGVNTMVVGSITKIQKSYYLNAQVVDVQTAEIVAAGSEESGSFKKLKKLAAKMGKAFAEKIPPGEKRE